MTASNFIIYFIVWMNLLIALMNTINIIMGCIRIRNSKEPVEFAVILLNIAICLALLFVNVPSLIRTYISFFVYKVLPANEIRWWLLIDRYAMVFVVILFNIWCYMKFVALVAKYAKNKWIKNY